MKRPVEYQETRITIGRDQSRSALRQLLVERAEYGGWELRRLRRYPDGRREVWIRRKIIRVDSTLPPAGVRPPV